MYDQHTRGMATTRHRSLVGRGGRNVFVRDKRLAPKRIILKMSAHRRADISNLKKRFEQIELPAKLLDNFL